MSAGLSIQRKGDGVKDGGLACAGIAGNQVKSAFPKTFQVQFDPLGIRTEGGDNQFDGSHCFSSHIVSISFCVKASCSSLSG